MLRLIAPNWSHYAGGEEDYGRQARILTRSPLRSRERRQDGRDLQRPAKDGRDLQRTAEKGRDLQRPAEKGRDLQRAAEKARDLQ